MKAIATSALASLVLLAPIRTASAQQGVTELGVDMAFAYETESETFGIFLPAGGTLENLVGPQGSVRAGFFLSDAVSLEPATSLSFLSGGGDTFTSWALALKLMLHLQTDPSKARPYLAAGGTLNLVDGGGDSASQLGVVVDVGVKLPIAERIGARLAASYTHGFDNNDFASRNVLAAIFGISMYLGG